MGPLRNSRDTKEGESDEWPGLESLVPSSPYIHFSRVCEAILSLEYSFQPPVVAVYRLGLSGFLPRVAAIVRAVQLIEFPISSQIGE